MRSEMLEYGQDAEEEVRKHERREMRGEWHTYEVDMTSMLMLLHLPCLRIVIFART